MRIRVLGSGTSQGVPIIACACRVCRSTDPRDKRLRVSMAIEACGSTLVVDTGPDFRQQMLLAGYERVDGVLITHSHKDHVAGLDDIRAYNFRFGMDMPVWADAISQRQLRQEFSYIFENSSYPGVPRVKLLDLPEEPFTAANIPIQPIRLWHHKLPVTGFRVGNFAYCTDVNRIPTESMAQLRGLDVLILDALRHQPHLSHFTLKEALEVVEALRPGRTYLTHISHLLGTHADVEANLPPHVYLAYDGLTIELPEPAG